jgi:cephalosporin-C deacetylase-like acetyl esterase
LVAPIYKGTYERRDGLSGTGLPRAFYRDHLIMITKDLRRSLDYLESRRDIDATRIGYLGASFGGQLAPIFLAIEPRIKTAVLDSGGLMLRRDMPEVDRLNFVSRVHTPVLMLNGRFDTLFPLETSQIPLFRLLGTPPADKKHVIYEGGHGDMPYKDKVRQTLDWFDRYLGAVRRD